MISCIPDLQLNAVADNYAQLVSIAGKVITIRTVDAAAGGSGADIGSHANNRVHFILLVKNVT